MTRLPIPGSDDGTWGAILNAFLEVAHNDDGTIKNLGVVAAKYVKPTGGIPETDLSSDVQTKLNSGGTAGDATSSVKGLIQLAGDLGGTASVPTVPGLADKVDTTDARLSDARTPTDASVTNAKVAANAAIAQSKLNLSITNNEVASGAAISKSKLAALNIGDADVNAISESKITGLTSDLAGKADDNSVIHNTLLLSKGDLIAATDVTTPGRLGVGDDGQVLTADSSQGTGLAWSTLANSAHTIQDESIDLAQRAKLNFVGAGVTVTDDSSNDATLVTIPGGGGGGGSSTAFVAAVSSSNTSGGNGQAIQDAVTAAEAAAAQTGMQATVVIPAGNWHVDYPQHTLMTSTTFTTGTDTVMNVKDATDFPSSGNIKLTDLGMSAGVSINTTATLSYTKTNATTLSITGVSVGSGQTFKTGDGVSVSGVSEARGLITIPNGNIEIKGYGATLDVSDTFYVNQSASSAGPQIFKIGNDVRSATQYYLKGTVWPAQQFMDVGRATQPNGSFDGTYTGGEYAADNWVLLQGDGFNDNDSGRYNPPGEAVRIADAREFSTMISATLNSGTGPGSTFSIVACLGNRQLIDPNDASTTLSGTLNSGDTSATLAAVNSLTLRSPFNSETFVHSAGLLYINDGTNDEFVHFEGVDYDNGKILNLQRGMLGTSAHTFASGVTVRMVDLCLIDSELIAYSKATNNAVTIRKRGVNSTTVATHTVGTSQPFVIQVPIPGRIFFRTPTQHSFPYSRSTFRNINTTKLTVALGSSYTEGTQVTVECEDLTRFAPYGLIKIGSEVMSYTHRDSGRFYNVTRGVHGTSVAVHNTSTAVSQVGNGIRLTAAIDNAQTSLPVNGASLYAPIGQAKYTLIDDELIPILGGSGTTSLSGMQYKSTTVTDVGGITAASTTITLASMTNIPDPVATGVGWAFVTIDNEVIQYTGISGSQLTGCKRGYNSLAAAHSSGATVKCYYQLNATSRGYGQTAAASHSAGAYARQSEPPFAQKLSLANKVRVHGLEIYSTGTRQLYPRVLPNGGALGQNSGNRRSSFAVYNAKDITFHDLHIDGTERDGISMELALDIQITSCSFDNIDQQGFGYPVDIRGASQDVVVIGNTMRNNRHGGIVTSASGKPGQPRRIIFAHNHVEDSVNAGWESQASGEDILVEGNTFVSSTGPGCLINNFRTKIRGNTFRSMSAYAIQLANYSRSYGDFEISGNTFENCDQGVWLFMDDTSPVGGNGSFVVNNNFFRNCRSHALKIQNNSSAGGPYQNWNFIGVQVTGNVVMNGTYLNSSSGSGARFWLGNLEGAVIANNVFADVLGDEEAMYVTNTNNSVFSNNVARYRSASATTSKSGIVLLSGNHNLVTGNRVTGSSNVSPIDVSGATNTTSANNDTG